MSSARYIVGDVFDTLATIPDDSIDLVLTSPPFLALRSYLPADHPDKAREIGSEPTPGAFIDTLLALTEEWARVLTPHGSICIELGDTYSGSGGAGGDYNADGLRDGQEKFDGSASRLRSRNDGGQYGHYPQGGTKHNHDVRPITGGDGWPEAKSMCLIPELYRLSLAYGFNPLTGRQTPRWRVRNNVRWCRPNPPVGALGDKFRPATSDMVIACKAKDRYFDLDAVRTEHAWPDTRHLRADHKLNGRDDGFRNSAMNPVGAPPLDWWQVSTEPYKGSHFATWPTALLERPIKAMCPQWVCDECGHPVGDDIGCVECGGDQLRPGVVLDPFAGSGTTLLVATGHGRDAIGIDLDARNADLARERVGMFLTVEQPEAVA